MRQSYDWRMKHPTPAYWQTRIMLAAVILLPVAVAMLWLLPSLTSQPNPAGAVMPVVFAVGAVLWLVGLVWMIRIFRGPRDEPPPWRYRDR